MLIFTYTFMVKQHAFAKSMEGADAGDLEQTVKAAASASVTEGPNRFRMEPAWKNLKTLTLHQFLSTQAATLADRAVFLIGFSQSGVSRFISTASAKGFVYLLFVSASCVLAIVAGFLLTALLLFLSGAAWITPRCCCCCCS